MNHGDTISCSPPPDAKVLISQEGHVSRWTFFRDVIRIAVNQDTDTLQLRTAVSHVEKEFEYGTGVETEEKPSTFTVEGKLAARIWYLFSQQAPWLMSDEAIRHDRSSRAYDELLRNENFNVCCLRVQCGTAAELVELFHQGKANKGTRKWLYEQGLIPFPIDPTLKAYVAQVTAMIQQRCRQ